MRNKKTLYIALALVVAAALMAGAYFLFMPKGTAGAKQLAVRVVGKDGETADFSFRTGSEYLRGALEEQKLIAGDESEFGLYVRTVNGYTADDSKQEWWLFTRNGESLMTGVDATPIADGEQYEIALTTGY
ncbi:MAG: DUF4430 domain-containing protein [Clostridiales bacterium]|nr:DUF4430 domain-containing protein [Clostridiales bacterium]